MFKFRRNEKCIDCGKCEKACPTGEAGREDMKMECYMCNRCVEACPFDAIKMDHDFEIASYHRINDNIYNLERLLKPASYYATIRPMNFEKEKSQKAEKEAAKGSRRT